MGYSKRLYFSDSYEWIEIKGNEAKIGVTKYKQVYFKILISICK